MDIKVLIASFVLVFLAELGDKTQLTALAFTTRFNSPWTVFIGTSLALVATTALAVVFGSFLTKVVPPRILNISSATLFILIGLFLLVNMARRAPDERIEKETEGEDISAVQSHGVIFDLVMNQAPVFEEKVLEYLESLCAKLDEGRLKDVLQQVIAEDKQHLKSLHAMQGVADWEDGAENHADGHVITAAEQRNLASRKPDINRLEQIKIEVNKSDISDPKVREVISSAIAVEEELSDYYLALARMSKIHSVRDAFRWLSIEDLRHAQTLCSLINPEPSSFTPEDNSSV